MSRKIRISQCMIVKNEEKNIRRALSWGKEILSEQIVVDTGSTDRTVEIAREMGAKVYHFDWIGDFSAAKNHAIEQASGDWIAFLDADEYYSGEDAKKLYKILEYLQDQVQARRRCMIRSALLELDDEGKVFSTTCQNRVFSNSPYIRYVNKIHEKLKYSGPGQMVSVNMEKTLSIYHTGYSASAYRETDKISRNIRLLRETLKEEPENAEFWSYLGDSLYAAGEYTQAARAFERSLEKPTEEMSEERRIMAYFGLMRITSIQDPPDGEERVKSLRERAAEEQRESPDLDYWAGLWMYRHGKKEETRHYLEACLRGLEEYKGIAGLMVTGELRSVYGMLTHTCLELGDRPSTVRYGVLTLRLDRYMDAALEAVLALLREEPGQNEDPQATCQFLEKLYDFAQIRDRLYVMKAAKKMGFHALYDLLYSQLNEEERKWLDRKPRSPYRLDRDAIGGKYPGLTVENETDMHFVELIEEVERETKETLFARLKDRLSEIGKKHPGEYRSILKFHERYPYWGRLKPEEGEYETLERRLGSLKEYLKEFIWLYGRLEDNRSRRALYAILNNWLHMDYEGMAQVRENGVMYFDTDLIASGEGAVYVDAGAYIGDSALNFIKTYGEGYGRIYCYEITPESVENMKRNTRSYHDIEIRQKALGNKRGIRYIEYNEDQSANRAVEPEGGADLLAVELVKLDEDVEEAVDMIKLDVGGMEEEALRGCENHIRKEHPKLAVSVYHGYEDLWKLPRIIGDMDPSYHFYLRHYGGALIPTEFILYVV